MSLDPKQYPNRKDQRKPYRGSKAFDCSCRNHGSCDWCKDNRTIQAQRANESADAREQVEDTIDFGDLLMPTDETLARVLANPKLKVRK